MAEMKAVAGRLPAARRPGQGARGAALARLAKAPEPFDAAEARARFDAAFEGRWAA